MEQIAYAATIGMFDGLHRGHRFVLARLTEAARRRGLRPMVVTFDRPPHDAPLLTPLPMKLRLLAACGIERCEVLPFTPELKALTARQFMERLRYQFQVRLLLTGHDHRFGRNREEGFDDYVRYGRELGIDVEALPAEGTVSSSLVRRLLTEGNVEEAARCLGRPYRLEGTVGHGRHLGTDLGFPTANLVLTDSRQLLPAAGAYAVAVQVADERDMRQGMMNVGMRPTVGGHHLTLETHVFDFSADLYAQPMAVALVARLRAERRFGSTDELRVQLERDAIEARRLLTLHQSSLNTEYL